MSDLSGSGGAERLFSDLHEHFDGSTGCETTLVTSRSSLARLRAAGRLRSGARVVALAVGENGGRGAVQVAWTTVRLAWTVLARRFDVVHICLPTPTYVPLAAILSRLPRAWRPAVTLTVIDCTLATSLDAPPPVGTYERQVLDAHRMYFRWARVEGIYSWYRNAVGAIALHRLAPGAIVRAAACCFTDNHRFVPAAKENLVVFAGRLSEQKRPLLFVDAIGRLAERYPHVAAGLRVEMYGKGILESAVRDRIARLGLEHFVTLTHAPDMAPVFARSRLFVSTQAIENFTSLAMLEAMAAGNAVVAANVGQTAEFVHDGDNGVLARDESADAFADAIVACLEIDPAQMTAASRRIATEVQTISNFSADITAFWRAVASPRVGHVGS